MVNIVQQGNDTKLSTTSAAGQKENVLNEGSKEQKQTRKQFNECRTIAAMKQNYSNIDEFYITLYSILGLCKLHRRI